MSPAQDPLRAARLERRALLAVVAAALVLLLLAIQWGLPNVESWNGDDIAPDKPLRVVYDWLHGHHKYPYLHWWLTLPLYAPWIAGVALAGQVDLGCFPRLRPSCFADPWRDMTAFLAISRLLSVAMALGIVLATRRLALALHGDRAAALLAAAIAGGSPTLVFFAHTANVDVPHVFWFTLSLAAGVALWRRGAPVDYLLFGVFAGCAITTKDPILSAYVLPGAALLAVHVARVRRETGLAGAPLARRALGDRRLLAMVGIIAGMYVVVQNVLFNFAGFREHWRFWFEGGPVFKDMRTRAPSFGHFVVRFGVSLEGLLGFAMFGFCAAATVYAVAAQRRTAALLLPLVSYFVLGLLPAFVEPRLMLPLLPIFAVYGGVLGARLLRARGALRSAAAAVLAAVFFHEYGAALHLDLRMLDDSRYEAEAWLREHVPPGARIAALSAPRFVGRVQRLGFDVRWYAPTEVHRGTLEADGAEWAILTGGGHPWTDRSYLTDLRAGRLGYDVAYVAKGRRPLPRWLDTSHAIGAVSPPVYVLRKRAG